MAVAKRCDRCGKYYEALPENIYSYEEDGKEFSVNSFRIGNWNAKTKQWESIVSGYDLCKDCGKELIQCVFDKGELQTRVPKFVPKGQTARQETSTNDSDESV